MVGLAHLVQASAFAVVVLALVVAVVVLALALAVLVLALVVAVVVLALVVAVVVLALVVVVAFEAQPSYFVQLIFAFELYLHLIVLDPVNQYKFHSYIQNLLDKADVCHKCFYLAQINQSLPMHCMY